MKRNLSTVQYDPELVMQASFPAETEIYLLQNGLPSIDAGEAVLGICFTSFEHIGFIQEGAYELLPIGYEWDPCSAILGIAKNSGHVYSYQPNTKTIGFMNSNIQLFLSFLSSTRSFISSNTGGEPETMTLMTQSEAAERLAAFHRGEIVPQSRPQRRGNREADLKMLRETFIQRDPNSLADDNMWWSCVLEQLEVGLL
ncbi:hypothetical protein GRF59_03590 [Paenibacillus sp. HJL G12]|uniref:SUKH-4 immunity protein n=1 Tax=Paenibacillus dendrobii TaxID=2691084 RepID=A0A7X3IFU5_9BACL|nr:hypothetical protein [Paenibacillus dendrobii]